MQARDSGFTLLEALVALAVSSIVAAGLMSALGSAGRRSAEVDVRTEALLQAQRLLAEAIRVTNLDELPRQGVIESPRLSWTVEVGPRGEPYPNIQIVTIAVAWSASAKEGVTRIAFYRFSPA